MNPTGGRPVVVNSLLCFLKNYREQSNILQIIDQYFTLESRRLSYQILLELLSETDRMTVASSPCTPSLLELFDRVIQSDASIPVFAADDLTILPLSLNYDNGNEQPKDLYNEVRQLRLYVHNALGQKAYNPALWKRQNNQFDINQQANNMKSSPPPNLKQKQPIVNDFNVSSLLKNDRANVQCSPTSSSSSTSSEINPISLIQKPTQQQRRLTTRPRKQPKSLDKAVQKLTDRLLKSENNNNEECHFENNNEFDHKNEEIARENNNNTIASAFGSSAAAITAQFIQNFTNQTFENARLPNPLLATSNAATHFDELQQDNNDDTDKEIGNEFGHENEKTSSQSSPTPSDDMSINRDCMDSTSDADKPYVCSQFNCRKRFSNKFLLKKHQFIHTGLRPHICPFCSKQFNRKDNLLRHKKTHLNNALAQMSGRKRHNALTGVSEESFNLFNQVNNLMESKNFQFANEDSNEANHLNSFNDKLNEESMDDEA